MIRAVSLLFVLSVITAGLLVSNFGGAVGLVETLLGILVIVAFAIIATGWTIDHDV
jgi:hypothetical protein